MRSKTEELLAELNAKRAVSYPAIGYCYFADIKGDGRNIKSVWQIVNSKGGVSYAHELNGRHSRQRCENIRKALAAQA